jgi:hypothetical protein
MDKIVLPVGGGIKQSTIPPIFTELKLGNDTFKINDKGEAVGDDGKVIKTKEELEVLRNVGQTGKTDAELAAERALIEKTVAVEAQLVEGTELELDGTKYILNKDGAIEKDGKVFKTKAELKTLLLTVDSNAEPNYVEEIQKVTNISPITDDGKPITYENTLQGLAQREQDVFTEGKKLGKTEYEQILFEQYPILTSIIDHLTIHGSLKDFNEDVDYSKITITDDENQQIAVYTKAQLQRGIPQTEINETIGYLKTDKKLKIYAESALSYLKTSQAEAITTRATQAKSIKDAQDADQIAYWDQVNKAITGKELTVGDKKFKLPDVIKIKEADGKIINKTLKDFEAYINKPLNFKIDNKVYTMTQLQYDTLQEDTKRTPHHDIFDAYRKFTKYDDSQLIAANVNSNTVKNIIKLTTKAGGGGSGTTGSGRLKLPIH